MVGFTIGSLCKSIPLHFRFFKLRLQVPTSFFFSIKIHLVISSLCFTLLVCHSILSTWLHTKFGIPIITRVSYWVMIVWTMHIWNAGKVVEPCIITNKTIYLVIKRTGTINGEKWRNVLLVNYHRHRAFSYLFCDGENEELNDSQIVDSHSFPQHFFGLKEQIGLAPAAIVECRRQSFDKLALERLDHNHKPKPLSPAVG